MSQALALHDGLLRTVVEANRGVVVKMVGDGMHAAFDDPLDAVNAALAIQLAIADPAATYGVALRVRCAVHVGAVERRDNDFFGATVNRAARLMSAAHGGQVLLSQAVVDLIQDRMAATVSLRDLGAVRLRDLAVPEHVYQLLHPQLRQDFPALSALESISSNLPRQLTSFIGRERELMEVKQLLGASRLLTLVGAGGIGKTRLALQVAATMIDSFPGGVSVADLAPIVDPASIPSALDKQAYRCELDNAPRSEPNRRATRSRPTRAAVGGWSGNGLAGTFACPSHRMRSRLDGRSSCLPTHSGRPRSGGRSR